MLVVIDLPDPKTSLRALFPHYFFLVTNWRVTQRSGWALLEHYRRRGTFEDRLGEFNGAIGNGLSADSFEVNEASLLLKLLAFSLAGMLRGELEDASGCGWDLKRVQQTVLKAGARLDQHSRRVIVDVAAAAGVLWDRVLGHIARCWRPAPAAAGPRGAPTNWGRAATAALDAAAAAGASASRAARVMRPAIRRGVRFAAPPWAVAVRGRSAAGRPRRLSPPYVASMWTLNAPGPRVMLTVTGW